MRKDHLFSDGGESYAWSLSYAAGSSISMNLHLAAAQKLGCATATDSPLHHHLLLRKMARTDGPLATLQTERLSGQIAQNTMLRIVSGLAPTDQLGNASIQDIMRFRVETSDARRAFYKSLKIAVEEEISNSDTLEPYKIETRVSGKISRTLIDYQGEVDGAQQRLWPRLLASASGTVPTGTSAAGLAASYVSGSGYVLAASVILAAVQPIKEFLDWRADLQDLERKPKNPMSYLVQVTDLASGAS